MSGIGNPESGMTLVSDRVSLPGTVDEILEKLRQILKLGSVQRVSLDVSGSITYDRYVSQDELKGVGDFAATSIMDFIRNVNMHEAVYEEGDVSLLSLAKMWGILEAKKLTVAFLVVSAGSLLWEWLGVREVEDGGRFWGAQVVVVDSELNPDVFLLCGAAGRYVGMSDVVNVVKGSAE
jgi:hypothetical protein